MKYLERNLHYLKPNDIDFDPHNPRGETEKQIISDKDFKRLVVSVKEFGVLEPIIVRKDGRNKKSHILVDGERRWRASLKANLSEVPALVAKDEINGRILAYQVHKLRKDWSKATETKSIKKIIDEIRDAHPNVDISEKDLKKKIREITNSPADEIRDIMYLIRYDDDIIEKVIEEKTKLRMSHL
ncbi:MAG: ParB/RepB/Spo0J family partition protein, partial [Phycisphaerales bacterium]